ncbi:hypothetical protein [Mucilaginibacter jinjuensis]|uniref:Uncharacterized protein n=1 Tax=Mucilaginibacter jinjuensis TaxID=1176721 RepID=A0ABY7TE77_9SPHI|nr:hypothetical protein [Mucilaginibacter jinjuensis]WCT13477.1 hypothetical protein PQO05_05955 [Mucilaginibacter jinjuensis]
METKGKRSFIAVQALEIKELLHKIRLSKRDEQKMYRNKLRKDYKFYICEFTTSNNGFTPDDFDNLVNAGIIYLT